MNRASVHGDAGLAPLWVDQKLVRLRGVTRNRPAARFPGISPASLTLRLNGGSIGMLADEVDYVIGVDRHRDQHTLAVVTAPAGGVLAETVIRACTPGYADAHRFAERHARGRRAWAVEGACHYGGA
jgi:hypothetical protein